MTTVYSPQYAPYEGTNGYLRAVVTYSTAETQDGVVFSGTVYLQHNGVALNDSYWGGWSAGIDQNSEYLRGMIAETADIASISAHSTWTTIASVQFSKTFDKGYSSYTKNCRLGIVSDLILASIYEPYGEINIEVPALESWDVTYDANGGASVPSAQKKYYGKDLTLSSSKPSRANYAFYHWNTQPNNSGTTYEPGATYTANAALSLYAIWNAKISYNMNGGTSEYNQFPTQTKTYGTSLTLHSGQPTRTGYVFNGWNTAADGTGTAFQPGGTYSAEISVTLYAQWLSLPAKPSIPTMTAIRWNETTDQQDDTGTSAKVTAEWSIDTTSEYYGNTNTGTVTLTVTPQSGSSSHTITPVSGTSGASGTAVFMVSGLDTDMQYTCKVTVTDLNDSSNRSVILTRAFFIMDFKAGGTGIGIGRAAPNSGLEIGYNVTCDQALRVYENEKVDGNLTIDGITTHTGKITANGNIFANARMRIQKELLAMDEELRGDLRVSGNGGISAGKSASLDDLYVAVTDATTPTFQSGKFYSREYNSTIGTIAYTKLTSEPADWNTAWTSYYRAKSNNGLFKCTYDTEFEDMSTAEINAFLGTLDIQGPNLIDAIYPVGSYYETSDTTFNPNTAWGGTWVLETEGQVHVSAGENYEVGDTGGEETHTLVENELPEIDGYLTWHGQEHGTHVYHVNGHFYGTKVASQFQTTGATSGAESWSNVGYKFGANGAHNNMQPYIVVNRWHRTA